MKKMERCLPTGRMIIIFLLAAMPFLSCEDASSSGGGSGALFSENFEGSDDTWLSAWFYTGDENFTGNYSIYHEPGANGTSHCLNLFGGYGNLDVFAATEVSSSGITPTTISYYIMAGDTTHDCGDVRTYSSGGSYSGVWCYMGADGYIHLNANEGDYQVMQYAEDTWYHIEFRDINWSSKSFDFYINNSLKNSGASLLSLSANDARFFSVGNWDTGSDFYIDEIVMK